MGGGLPRSLCSLAMTKRPVILNAKRERIRNPLERETDCRGAYSLLRCPKVVIRLEREQLLTAALPFARFFLHRSESNVTRNDKGIESRKVNCNDG